jgi:hypothetical protein
MSTSCLKTPAQTGQTSTATDEVVLLADEQLDQIAAGTVAASIRPAQLQETASSAAKVAAAFPTSHTGITTGIITPS